jgi:sensor c-di-GMP phosphodiesterase-like protein
MTIPPVGRETRRALHRQLDADLLRQSALERDLREALARGELALHYQPQYDCRTLRLSSAEALTRAPSMSRHYQRLTVP